MNQSIRNLLAHLFENYGNITQLELEDNDTKMRSLWDPNSPFDCLVQQLEDGQDYADDGGQPYTTDQLLRIAYTLVFKLGYTSKIARHGMQNPTMKKHGQTSKRISNAHNVFSMTSFCTTKQAGFTSNFAIQHHPQHDTQPPPEYRDALVNLATSAAANRELLTIP